MYNSFLDSSPDYDYTSKRVDQLENGKVGFYSVGLYPISLAYNCAMQNDVSNLLLAPRPGRKLFGAFPQDILNEMDKNIINGQKA